MLQKLAFLTLFIIAGSKIQAQEGWIKQPINDRVTVSFPLAPNKINENSFGIKDQEGTTLVVTTMDIAKMMDMSVKKFNEEVTTKDFADLFYEGFTPTMSKYVFKPLKITELKDQPCYQLIGRDEKTKTTIYLNIIFVDGISHSLAVMHPDGVSDKNKDLFLTNITVK